MPNCFSTPSAQTQTPFCSNHACIHSRVMNNGAKIVAISISTCKTHAHTHTTCNTQQRADLQHTATHGPATHSSERTCNTQQHTDLQHTAVSGPATHSSERTSRQQLGNAPWKQVTNKIAPKSLLRKNQYPSLKKNS